MRHQLRLRLAALLLVAPLVVAACGSDDDGGGGAGGVGTLKDGELLMCSDIPYEPMEFEGEGPDGLQYTGFDVELINAVAKESDLKLKIKAVLFDGILGNLAAKDCDVAVSSITITDERKEQVLFSDPYFDADQSLLVTKEGGVKALDELTDETIAVQSGTTGADYAEANKPDGATVKAYDDTTGMFGAIASGDVAAVLQDFPINAYRATKDDSVEVVETFKTDEQYGFAVRKDNTALQTALNDGLEKVRGDSTYDDLYEKYFGVQPA